MGEFLLMDALQRALKQSEQIAAMAVVVDAHRRSSEWILSALRLLAVSGQARTLLSYYENHRGPLRLTVKYESLRIQGDEILSAVETRKVKNRVEL